MGNSSAVCWDWALSPVGLAILAAILLVPFLWRILSKSTISLIQTGLIGLFAVFVIMGGCRGLAMTGWLG